MAWRPSSELIEGELDNTEPGKVTGWMRFVGLDEPIIFDLKGNFHRDIRGAKIRFTGEGVNDHEERDYMESFALRQTGKVGDITAGLAPQDYGSYPYIEWYSNENGRVVIELDKSKVEIIGRPIPVCESDPVSREEQSNNMRNFLTDISQGLETSKKPI